MADTVSLTTVVPGEHAIVVKPGAHGAVRYGETEYSETATFAVGRFDSASIAIVPEYGYKLGAIRVSSDKNVQLAGMALYISSAVEDLTVELSFVEMEWEAPEYVWSEDNSSVTATRISKDDPTVKMTETAKAVATVTKEPTCTAKGVTTYSAAFADPKFTAQSKQVENIEMVAHTPVLVPAVPATAEEDGKAKGVRCSVCKQVFSGFETINHNKQILTPHSLTVIDTEAFEGVNAHQIILSDNVSNIGHRAFANCSHLALVYIPGSVREIADDAFSGSAMVTLQVEVDSFAHRYAVDNGIDYIVYPSELE